MNCRSCGTRMVVVTNIPGSWLCSRCGPQTDRVAAWELEVEQLRTAQRAAAAMTMVEWRQSYREERTTHELVWIIDPTTGDFIIDSASDPGFEGDFGPSAPGHYMDHPAPGISQVLQISYRAAR